MLSSREYWIKVSVTVIHNDFCPSVKNILLLDSEGKRVAVKYYSDDWPTNSAKEAFEKAIFTKTQKTNARTEAEIAMFENNIIVYKFVQDLHFYVSGSEMKVSSSWPLFFRGSLMLLAFCLGAMPKRGRH
ncbi:Coatomer subunit zeta-1 [Sesamum angolense]|uniref:Coatomer subunit zeta n=1 Tax=Sesamum angolense TaxID=2727404 RepID=A0AAE1WUC0_9LAMI|nr:Coatomer subunit zeta-1 [Sesamum angolense]